MCGIVAIYSPQHPVGPAALEAATSSLRHRGPDGQSTWIGAEGCIGLGHTRLTIAAPTGPQPIADETERRWIVVNGEFYGFPRLRQQLKRRGHCFRTETDSEVALHLYEDLGPDCLAHLRGEFAFVLWDGATHTLFAARDRFGVKPLFYARHGDALLLASEAKALFAAGLPSAWDREAVYAQLFGCFRNDRSLFAGVRQVPPGHYLLADPNGVRLARYWDVNYPRRNAREQPRNEGAIVVQVRELLDEAVRLRMTAHVPVGYLLSGGLDSSAVLSVAALHSDRPLRAFTIGFDHAAYDESHKARIAAAHAGAAHCVVPVTDADVADHFARSIWHGESIQFNAHGTARFLLSRAIQADGYRAVMAGEGADELFAGYGFTRPASLGSGSAGLWRWAPRLLSLLKPLNAQEQPLAAISPSLVRLRRLLDLPPSLVDYLTGALTLLHGVVDPAFGQEFAGFDPHWDLLRGLDWRDQIWGREPAKQITYLWLRSIFANYHMAADRLDMAHAVEVRLPFLDHKLFEVASQIPVALLARGMGEKPVLREATRPVLPEAIYRGAKQPFYAPPSTLRTGGRLHAFTQETLRSRGLADLPFFDQRAVLALLDRAPALDARQQAMLDPLLMVVLSLCVLQAQYKL